MGICLLSILGQQSLCIPEYMVGGIVLFIVGILVGTFVPFDYAKKLSFIMVVSGIFLVIGIPILGSLLTELWKSKIVQMFTYFLIAVFFIIVILFPESKTHFFGKK